MHPRRRSDYRISYRNPVAVDPARAYAMKAPASHKVGTCTIRSQATGLVTSSIRKEGTPVPVHEAAASGSVTLVLKHENNVAAVQVSASPCFVKLHEQCSKMCASMEMNGLSKSGSHSTGHHDQSVGLVRFGKCWLCQTRQEMDTWEASSRGEAAI